MAAALLVVSCGDDVRAVGGADCDARPSPHICSSDGTASHPHRCSNRYAYG